jgi:long-chain acyl-CoA synthetase
MEIRTLNDVFFSLVDRNNDRAMLTRGETGWTPISSAEFYRRVAATVRQLSAWGFGQGDRVVILSENRPEWAIADFATLILGGIDVPIYATLTAEQSLFLFQHSEARIAFVSTRQQYEKVASIRSQTAIERIVIMDDITDVDAVSMQSFLRDAPAGRDAELDALARSAQPDDLATLIYTSGTTGTPKGAMLTHGNVASNINVSLQHYDVGPTDSCISFLPLSHITARHLDYAMFCRGVTLAYCPNIDDLPRTLREIKPTLFVAVPRVYEKVHNQVVQKASRGLKHKIYNWAMAEGAAHRETILSGETPKALGWKLANRLLFSKVRDGVGGHVRLFISGGAPLGRELASWYADIGIRIHEGYGLTETSPVIALNNPRYHRIGTVGKQMPNIELRIEPDGELLVRGPSIFKGYWNMPEETQAAFEGDWFRTGDIATLDEHGFLSITDRKKDLIKTSGGKFIAPQPIENSLKSNLLVGEAALLGEKRRFPAVLIVPNFPVLEEWAQANGVKFSSHEELVQSPTVQALYEALVEELNSTLAQYQKLKKVLLIPSELSIADGTLTPSMKLRRRHLEQRYKREIEALYADAKPEAVVASRR